jgi:hypothetical protein
MSDLDRDRELVSRSDVIGPQADDALPPHPNEIAAWLERQGSEREEMTDIETFLARNPDYLELFDQASDLPEVSGDLLANAQNLVPHSVAANSYIWTALKSIVTKPVTGAAAVALTGAMISGFSMGSAANHAEKLVFNAVAAEMTFGLQSHSRLTIQPRG